MLAFLFEFGGGIEIRTLERGKPSPVFKTGAFNHSAIPPMAAYDTQANRSVNNFL